jgi:hypothetical protein
MPIKERPTVFTPIEIGGGIENCDQSTASKGVRSEKNALAWRTWEEKHTNSHIEYVFGPIDFLLSSLSELS